MLVDCSLVTAVKVEPGRVMGYTLAGIDTSTIDGDATSSYFRRILEGT